ncbi:acyltransferase [Glycomyces sp. L485]|uniref:acyltransferase family protein n=1 Tax=Glycomyces sp. L485 TaxID=2909235 RepID=UPI001F4AD720|nr:acyltransferase family protein [Glycomyces sp. L485]MCH7231402.1 acyltransferase [Glycomyces sp. L485]
MTSPQQPPRPHTRVTGAAIDEETLHLPLTTPGRTSAARPTMPSPYPQHPAFRPAPPPQQAVPMAQRPVERWEGIGFRPDIQGLRAVAVMLVLLSHAGFAFAEGGYVGVDVFFVLSGFLITSLLVKEVFDTGRISIAGFYARRARRILPAASVVAVLTVVGAWLWFPVTRIEEVMQDAFTVIVYVVNYRFIAESTEYLNADQMPSPFQQYWSLAVEEQFYLVWPLLLIALLLMVKRVPRKLVGVGVAFSIAIFALTLVLSVFITEQSQSTAYYAAHTRAWELAGGAFLALTLPTWKRTPQAAAWALGVVGLGAVIVSALLYDNETAFPGYTALLPVLGTMLVIVAGTSQLSNPVSSLLGTKPFQFVGKISYSLYLWHWPVLILFPLALGVESSLLLNVVLLAGTFAIAQLSYEYIEEPVRRAKLLKTSNMWGLATGIVCSLLGIGLILTLTIGFPKSGTDEPPVDLEAVEEVDDLSEIETKLRDALESDRVPGNLIPPLANISDDKPTIYNNSCHLEFEQTEWPHDCVFGDTESDTTVILMGDSHAAQWFPALETIASDRGWKLISRTKSSCTPVAVRVDNPSLGREYTECEQARESVFDEIDEIRPTMVVFASSETTELTGFESDETNEAWLGGWTDTIGRVGASAGHLVAIADTPWSDSFVPECVDLNSDSVEACNIDQDEGVRLPERRREAIELQEGVGVTVIDPLGWFCYDGTCPVVVDGILVYRDKHHVTTPYMKSLSGLIAEELPKL